MLLAMSNQETSLWDFPKFGTSPGSTPSYSSRSISPEPEPVVFQLENNVN